MRTAEIAVGLAEDGLRSARSLLIELGPSVIKEIGLLAALRIFIRELSARASIEVTISAHDLPRDISVPVQVAIYRALQQVLLFSKRAKAHTVTISFAADGALVVADMDEDCIGGLGAAPFRHSWEMLEERTRVLGCVCRTRQYGSSLHFGMEMPAGEPVNLV